MSMETTWQGEGWYQGISDSGGYEGEAYWCETPEWCDEGDEYLGSRMLPDSCYDSPSAWDSSSFLPSVPISPYSMTEELRAACADIAAVLTNGDIGLVPREDYAAALRTIECTPQEADRFVAAYDAVAADYADEEGDDE